MSPIFAQRRRFCFEVLVCDRRVSGQIHGCLGDSARPRSRARRHMRDDRNRHEASHRREGVAEANFFDERIGGAAEIVAAFAHQSEMRTVRVDAGRPHRACSAWTTQCQALDRANRRIVLLPWLRGDMSIAGQ